MNKKVTEYIPTMSKGLTLSSCLKKYKYPIQKNDEITSEPRKPRKTSSKLRPLIVQKKHVPTYKPSRITSGIIYRLKRFFSHAETATTQKKDINIIVDARRTNNPDAARNSSE